MGKVERVLCCSARLPVGDLNETPFEVEVFLDDGHIIPHAREYVDGEWGAAAGLGNVRAVSFSMAQYGLRPVIQCGTPAVKCFDDAASEASHGCGIYQVRRHLVEILRIKRVLAGHKSSSRRWQIRRRCLVRRYKGQAGAWT